MWSKRNRLAVATRIFSDLFWLDGSLGDVHTNFTLHELDDILSGEKTDTIDLKLVEKASKYFHEKGEDFFQNEFAVYIDDWHKTLSSVRAVLYTWLIEAEFTQTSRSELVGKYIKLTQDLVAGGSTSLVHALLSKMTGTYHPALNDQTISDLSGE